MAAARAGRFQMQRLCRGYLAAAACSASIICPTSAGAVSKDSAIRGAFHGTLVADALTLGTHYEYDATKIKKFYGAIDRYYAPGEKTGGETHGVGWGGRNFHGGNGKGPPKKAGEQTDYGDYNILLLEHLVAESASPHRLSLTELIPTWQKRMQTWRAWMCTQTKQTLQQVQQGTPYNQLGGGSNAMAVRHAAAYGYFDNEEDVVHMARTAMFTHRETTALEAGEFFGRVTFRVIHNGLTPRQVSSHRLCYQFAAPLCVSLVVIASEGLSK